MKGEKFAHYLPTNNRETINKTETNNKKRRFAFWSLRLFAVLVAWIFYD